MPSKSQTHTSGDKRYNQPRPHQNPTPTPSKSPRTPGLSRWEHPGEQAGWHHTAWRLRRNLKVQPTSQPQDFIRCYEAMTPGIYEANLRAKMEAEMGICFRENRRPQVQPASYENLLLPKRVPKKEARGTGEVGRRKTSANGLKALGRRETKIRNATLRNGVSESGRDVDRGVDLGRCFDGSAQVSHKSRKTPKQVRFDDESEWIDISDDNVPAGLVESERWSCARDEDEYILI